MTPLLRDFISIHPNYHGLGQLEGIADDIMKFLCPFGVKIGGTYRHFKGDDYIVTGLTRSSDDFDGPPLVKYVALLDATHEVTRPLKEFLENVDREDYKGPRFRMIA